MNREAIQELYAHIDYVWPQVVEIISESGDATLTKPAPGSGWPNLRNCFAHLIFAYESWLGFMTDTLPTNAWESVQSFSEIDAARAALRGRIDSLLAGLSDDQLAEIRTFNIRGEKMPYSYAELLAHVALHERGHHGDVTTLFWQLAIGDDPSFDYRWHLEREPLP
jgi:uncharacterized damage-inducible protein DinB